MEYSTDSLVEYSTVALIRHQWNIPQTNLQNIPYLRKMRIYGIYNFLLIFFRCSTDAQFVQPWNIPWWYIPQMRYQSNRGIFHQRNCGIFHSCAKRANMEYLIFYQCFLDDPQMRNLRKNGIFHSGIFHGCTLCASLEYSTYTQNTQLWDIPPRHIPQMRFKCSHGMFHSCAMDPGSWCPYIKLLKSFYQ